ncbi:hypothetical protein LCGC14_0549700 [marine sediment metagenome]|uniref:Uncharacterized protein n=1 Tax=marine sediment metagenome TaxID=412755 RepID=A0A0F9UYH4_9ZZZZ
MASYKERTRRITFDVPIVLKALIHSIIPPSRLSAIMRYLLKEILQLEKEVGRDKTLTALLNGRAKLIILPNYEVAKQLENKETVGEQR